MWPFKSRTKATPSYTQVDTTERFGDDEGLDPNDWIDTIPLNQMLQKSVPDPTQWGLPALGASDDEAYAIASRLSVFRESAHLPNEGVYCPICHIANTQIARLHTSCPRCERPLLQFGWT